MKKRVLAALISAAVGMSLVWVSTAPAQTGPTPPAEPNIVDPSGDANALNDQGFNEAVVCLGGNCVPGVGDQGDMSGGPNAIGADIHAVWFSDTPDTVSAHFQVAGEPPNSVFEIIYRVRMNPGPLSENINAPNGCVWIEGTLDSESFQGTSYARVRHVCVTDIPNVDIDLPVVTPGPEGTSIVTISAPRSASAAFAPGATLAGPKAETRGVWGSDQSGPTTAPQFDNTKHGTDYTLDQGAGQPGPKKCPSKGKKKGKGKPKPRPTGSPTASTTATPTGPATNSAGPAMVMQTTPAPSGSPTAKPTGPPGQDKPCPRQQGKNKPKPKGTPRPSGSPATPSATQTDS